MGTVSLFNSCLSPNPSNLCSRSTVTWSWQTIFRLKLNFSTVWPVPILWTHFIPNLRFAGNVLAFGQITFLLLTFLLLCFGIRILDIQAFHYHKTHKNNSNRVAVLVFTCCALPVSLGVVDSLRHTHAFSRVTLREFLVKWATMAAPMVSENVRFKITFMMYNILTKLNKKYMCYNILSWMVCGNWGDFNAFSTLWLHVPLRSLNFTSFVLSLQVLT